MRRRGATRPTLCEAPGLVTNVLQDSRITQRATRPDFIHLCRCINLLHDNANVAGSKLLCPIRRHDAGSNAKPSGLGQVPRQRLNWTATSPTGKLTP